MILEAHVRKYAILLIAGLLSVVAASSAQAQRRITGKVTAVSGEAIGSAQVQVQGTTLGTVTSDDGTFSLGRLPDGAFTLVVRRIGFRRTLVAVNATAATVSVVMAKDVLELDKMVVTGTVTSISSANSANAIASVSGEELTKAPSPTIENALQGKIAGAVVSTNSGAPGGGAQIQLRGVTSINGSSSPLYVIDGVLVSNAAIGTGLNSITNAGGGISSSQDQQTNRIADINPEDIENIEVLKGASAGAIYGSKASNGVIIITTKRGTNGKPRVHFQQTVGQFEMSHKLGLRCFGSAAEALDWWQNTIGGGSTLPTPWQPTCNDFEKQMYSGNDPSYQTDLSISGGNGSTTYYIGGSWKRDNAIQRNTYFGRKSLTANISQLIGDRLTVRVSNQFVNSITERGISGNDNSPVVSPGDIFSATPTWYNMAAKVNGQYTPNLFLSEQSNAFQNADAITNPEEVNRYIGSLNSTLSLYSSQHQTLDLTFIAGLDAYSDNSRLYVPPQIFVAQANGQPGTIVTNRTSVQNTNINVSGAHKLISDWFTATTSFGARQERRQSDQILNQGRNLPAGVTNVSFGVLQSLNEAQLLIKDVSYYAQEEFLTLGDRLLLTGAVNSERSSVNGDDKKFYNYPKAAISYRLPWLPKYVDELKVRGAWGQAGNQPPYGYKFTTLPTGIYDGIIGARPSATAGNPNIKPETSTEIEGGLDATMFHSRVAVSATAFKKDIKDLVLSAAVSPSTGFTTQFVNGGSLRNTGTEYSLSLTPLQTNDFQWVSRTTYATVWSQVTSLNVPCFNGGAYFSLRYGAPFICQGYSTTTVQADNGWDTTSVNGAFKSRKRHIQNFESAPKYTMGFSNEFTWKQWRLYGLFDYREGGYAVDLTGLYFDPTALLADTAFSNKRLTAYGKGYSAYLEPAGFVKLREISVSYTLPKMLMKNLFSGVASDVRLELSGRNLRTWTSYKGYDPEVSNFGNQNIGRFQDVTPYPPSRSFFFSVIANF
jgi:TonB-linked SusC/RagA family outer membrane protein